jgi:hypothetical protein
MAFSRNCSETGMIASHIRRKMVLLQPFKRAAAWLKTVNLEGRVDGKSKGCPPSQICAHVKYGLTSWQNFLKKQIFPIGHHVIVILSAISIDVSLASQIDEMAVR